MNLQKLEEDYYELGTLQAVAKKYRITSTTVGKKLKEAGAILSPTGARPGAGRVNLSKKQKRRIVGYRLNKKTLGWIGLKFGVSRERIRLVCKEAGLVPPKKPVNQKKLAAERSRLRREQRAKEIEVLSWAWKKGMSLRQLGELIGMKSSSSRGIIGWLRAKYPEKFPLREPK